MDNRQMDKRQIINALWARGNLQFFYRDEQLPLRNFLLNSTTDINVANVHRQFGKSTSVFAIYCEYCIRNPGVLVKYGAPTIKQVKEILAEVSTKVLETCPRLLRPKYNKTDGQFEFPNGSKIKIIGVNVDKGNRLRGSPANRVVLDEAGFMDNLEYVIEAIIMPQFLTTGGKLDIISTPSEILGHDFVHKYIPKAKALNSYYELPITSNPRYKDESLQKIVNQFNLYSPSGELLKSGFENDNFKREFLCQIFNDPKRMIIPEWEDLGKSSIKEWNRPDHFRPVVSADLGFKDHSGILFGYIDFDNDKLIVEDELFVNYLPPSDIANLILKKVKEHYPKHYSDPESIKWIADAQQLVLAEIRKQSGIPFLGANKYDRDGAINALRTKISQGRLIVNPRCKNLIIQLEQGNWNEHRTDWERIDHLGHCDLLAALNYMNRMAPWNDNPNPKIFKSEFDHFYKEKQTTQIDDAWAGIKPRFR